MGLEFKHPSEPSGRDELSVWAFDGIPVAQIDTSPITRVPIKAVQEPIRVIPAGAAVPATAR